MPELRRSTFLSLYVDAPVLARGCLRQELYCHHPLPSPTLSPGGTRAFPGLCLPFRPAREFAIRTATRTIQSKIVCRLVDVVKCRLVMTKYAAILQSGIVQLVAKLLLMHRNLITKYERNSANSAEIVNFLH